MVDNEIIKALECCVNFIPCKECPLERDGGCRDTIIEKALSLINRQKAEIERLLHENHTIGLVQNGYNDMLEICKAEAIKEFAERFKGMAGIYQKDTYVVGVDEFDNLVKEMVGDNE